MTAAVQFVSATFLFTAGMATCEGSVLCGGNFHLKYMISMVTQQEVSHERRHSMQTVGISLLWATILVCVAIFAKAPSLHPELSVA